jgi:hypothetical protein
VTGTFLSISPQRSVSGLLTVAAFVIGAMLALTSLPDPTACAALSMRKVEEALAHLAAGENLRPAT